MKVYLDLILLIDLLFDTLIILGVSLLFNYHLTIKRIILANIIGSLSITFIFFDMSKWLSFLLSLLISLFMIYISFGKKNLLRNIFYFYLFAIILGGVGNLFVFNKYIQNIILLLISAPLIIILYIRQENKYHYYLNKIYDVIILNKNNTYKLNGFRDTGNTLISSNGLPVIMLNKKYNLEYSEVEYVKCNVLNNVIEIKCINVDMVLVDGVVIDCLVGLVDSNVFNRNYEVILNENMKGIF